MLDFAQRFTDVMWRTIGNMGYLYARMENGRLHDVPVTVIEPGEQYSGFGPLHVFNAYPQKNRALMEAGYRDAKRALARATARRAPRAPRERSVVGRRVTRERSRRGTARRAQRTRQGRLDRAQPPLTRHRRERRRAHGGAAPPGGRSRRGRFELGAGGPWEVMPSLGCTEGRATTSGATRRFFSLSYARGMPAGCTPFPTWEPAGRRARGSRRARAGNAR